MPLLKTDNEGRNIPSVWLGPPDLIRIPFDATYGQWILGFAIALPIFIVLAGVVPVLAWVAIVAWFFGKFVTQRLPDRSPKLLLNPWFWRAAVGIFFLLAVPNPKLWILPMNAIAAAFFVPIIAFLVVRRVRKYLTPMTPIRYWMRVLWKLLRRPRSQAAKEFSPVAHLPEDEELGFDLGDIENPRPKLSLRKEVR